MGVHYFSYHSHILYLLSAGLLPARAHSGALWEDAVPLPLWVSGVNAGQHDWTAAGSTSWCGMSACWSAAVTQEQEAVHRFYGNSACNCLLWCLEVRIQMQSWEGWYEQGDTVKYEGSSVLSLPKLEQGGASPFFAAQSYFWWLFGTLTDAGKLILKQPELAKNVWQSISWDTAMITADF